MLKYIYEKFFQKFVIEDIAECFDSFEKQHKDILTDYCRCLSRSNTWSTSQSVSVIELPNSKYCGHCNKIIKEDYNGSVKKT